MAKKTKSLGTLLQANISGFQTIGQRVSIDGPSGSNEMVDISDLDSPAVERGPTIPDGGDVSLSIWFDPTDPYHMQLETWRASPPSTAPQFKLVFPTTPTKSVTFNAWVSEFKPTGIESKGYLQAEVKLSVTGLLAWA